jgi:hypothetical protein
MPPAFKASPDHPAVAYLVRLHADLGGQIQANKAEAERLAEAMRHVEAVIKLYDPDYSVRAISARRRVQGNPWFKRGTMFRHALDALRKGGAPMTVREVTDAVMAAQGITDATTKQRDGLEAALRSCLETNVGKTVQRAGEGVPRRWAIRG